MAEYEVAFRELSGQIAAYSPETSKVLDAIFEQAGAQAAYYAAFVFVCLHAKAVSAASKVRDFDTLDIQGFTFFEYIHGNEQLWGLFLDALNDFNRDQQTYTSPTSD